MVLRIEDYTWAPVSGVFDKLRKVGVLSYLLYVTPGPNEVHSTCNCRGAYVHQVPL